MAVLAGATAMLLVVAPKLIAVMRAVRQEAREDRKAAKSDYRQLLGDIRAEREEMREELKAVHLRHRECLKIAARQTEEIRHMAWAIDRLKEQLKAGSAGNEDQV